METKRLEAGLSQARKSWLGVRGCLSQNK
jgi:hypothetical protein